MRRSCVGTVIEAWSRNRHGQHVEPFPFQLVTVDDVLLAGRGAHYHGLDWMRLRVGPFGVDFFFLTLHAQRVNIEAARITSDGNRHVVASPFDVDDFFEQKSPALFFRQPAVLQAYQRMQLGIFIDRAGDANQLAVFFQRA